MYRQLLLVSMLVVLGAALLASPEFQTVAAGVAIFLFGMTFLGEGFSTFTGGALERVLQNSTKTLPRSLSVGVISTTIMQSSSLVSVLAISFLSAGLIGLKQGIGIIFGANIGTTTGAWLMAGFGMKVKISAYAMPMIVFGLIFITQKKRKTISGIGKILAGLGFLFLGIHFMKEGFQSLQESIDLAQYAMTGLAGLLVYALMGVFATVVMQSSHATLMLIIAALAAQQITYENALALAIGANVGTTITAILGAISSNASGKRLAGAHLVFNVVTGVIAVALIAQFKMAVDLVSGKVGIADDDWTLKLAVFHTIFNVVGVVVMVPFVNHLERFLLQRVPEGGGQVARATHLNRAALNLPGTALAVLERETQHLLDNAVEIVAHAIGIHRHDLLSDKRLKELVHSNRKMIDTEVLDGYYTLVKHVYSDIVDFATEAMDVMSPSEARKLHGLRVAARNIARAVKEVSFMVKNIERFSKSDNEAIRGEYDALRLQIAILLRRLYRIKVTAEPSARLIGFQQLRAEMEKTDLLANGELDRLVRTDAITKDMASSLMNDSGHTQDIYALLIEAGERLYLLHAPAEAALSEEALIHAEFSEAEDDDDDGNEQGGRDRDLNQTGAHPALLRESITGEYRRITGGDGDAREEEEEEGGDA